MAKVGLEKLQSVCGWLANVFTNFQTKRLGALGKKTHPMAEGVGTLCLPTALREGELRNFSLAALKTKSKAYNIGFTSR